MVVGVELNPEVKVAAISSVVNFTTDRAFLSLVGPVPKADSLGGVSTNGNNVLVVDREVNCAHSIRMRVEESPHWSALVTVPNDEHRIITRISCDQPPFVFRTSCGSDLVAVTLEEDLFFFYVVVDDTCV